MTVQRQVLFWLVALAFAVAFLVVFRPILLPFVAGIGLAYLLDPLVDWVERRGLGRTVATALVMAAFVLFFILAMIAVLPILVRQTSELVTNIPGYAARLRDILAPLSESRLAQFFGVDSASIRDSFSGLMDSGASILASVLKSVLAGGLAVVNVLSLIVVMPVVAFYLLIDWDRAIARIDGLLPRDHAATVRDLAHRIDRAIAGFIRGQGLVCVILGLFYATGLALIGLEFGLLIGLGAGLLSFIPYVGSLVGFVLSVGVALAQFWPEWTWIAATVGVFLVGQFIEGNILQPKLIGGSIGVHPVWLMFALFAFGYLFGFVGLLIAVPAAAAIAVLLRFATEQYLASSVYNGHESGSGASDGQ